MARVMVVVLSVLGTLTVLFGLVAAWNLADYLAEPSLMGGDGGLTVLEIALCGEIALLHVFFGACGIGLAQLIDQTRHRPERDRRAESKP